MNVLAAAHAAGPPHMFYVIGAVIGVPLVLWCGHKLGDLGPVIAGVIALVAVAWLGPRVPHSPIACAETTWRCPPGEGGTIALAEFTVPFAVIVLCKTLRGDYRRRRP